MWARECVVKGGEAIWGTVQLMGLLRALAVLKKIYTAPSTWRARQTPTADEI